MAVRKQESATSSLLYSQYLIDQGG